MATNNNEIKWSGTISALSQLDGRVYVRLATPELAKRFMQQAEAESFTFPDGAKPTSREPENFMAVNPDHTIHYIGTFGRMAYSIQTATVNGQRLIRAVYAAEPEEAE